MKLVLAVLLMGGIAWGQTIHAPAKPPYHQIGEDLKPLKCGKYQHEMAAFYCDECLAWIPAHCADDLHTVTEEEWQKLQERIKKLEEKPHATTYSMLPPRP